MRPRSRRAGVVFGIATLLASSCAPSRNEASLTDIPGADDIAEAVQVLAESDGTAALPAPRVPELLGLDVDEGVVGVPIDLAFELPALVSVGPLGAPEPPAGDDDEFESGDSGGDDDTPGDPTDSGTDEEDDLAATAETEVEGGEPVALLPAPPRAVPGDGPLYRYPSELIVRASGREFPLFDLSKVQTVRGVTDSSISIGGLATQTLVGNPHRQDVCLGARARFEQANHHGELRRALDLLRCHDDTGQADISSGLAASLVGEDAFAIVPLASPAFFGADVLHEAPILYVGDDRLPAFCGRANPLGFGIYGAQGCPVLDARGYVALVDPVLTAYRAAFAGENPWSNLTYVVADSPTGEAVAAARQFEASLLDVPSPWFVGALPPAGDGPNSNWSAIVATILDTTPDTIILDAETATGLPAALRGAGFDGELVWVGAIDPLDVVDLSDRLELAPMTVMTLGLDLASDTSAGARALVGAAAAVGVPTNEVGLDFVEGYLAADFLVQALAATPEPLSIEALANTVNAGWWYPGVDGVSCGSWWPASHFVVTPCLSVSRVEVFSDHLVPVLTLVQAEPQVQFNLGG